MLGIGLPVAFCFRKRVGDDQVERPLSEFLNELQCCTAFRGKGGIRELLKESRVHQSFQDARKEGGEYTRNGPDAKVDRAKSLRPERGIDGRIDERECIQETLRVFAEADFLSAFLPNHVGAKEILHLHQPFGDIRLRSAHLGGYLLHALSAVEQGQNRRQLLHVIEVQANFIQLNPICGIHVSSLGGR